MQNSSHFKSVSCFNRLESPATDNKRTKESMISLNIFREGLLEVTEINRGFSRPWTRSERKKKSLTLDSSLLPLSMIQYFFASVERT